MSIISLSGRISSGKDTVAKIIQEFQPERNWQVKKWAGKLKEVASLLTGVPIEYWEDQDFKKSQMSPQWGMTYREFLQKLGTDAMRDGLHVNVWVNALMSEYRPYLPPHEAPRWPNWIITDTRFPNEAETIREAGFVSIRINRYTDTGNHPSETALDNYGKFDFVIDNTGSLEDLRRQVGEILEKIG